MGPAAAGVLGILVTVGIFAAAIAAALVIFPHWRIFQRAGYSGALALLMVLPLVNLIVLLWFAFAEWPALQARAAETALPERRFGR
jgi:hypothetical protein